jgi:tetratricopeptide (TPR) repeat protein
MYDALQKALDDNYFDWGEGRSDNFRNGGTGQFQVDIALGNLSATTGAANWSNLYRTIAIANFAIKYIPRIEDQDATTRDHNLAQAHAMRALCYFYAVRIWGDVPVRLEPYEDIEEDPQTPRTAAGDVLNNVILPDLQTAEELVNAAVRTPVWNINLGAILTIQTDVYMWMGQYQNALDASQRLIDLNHYRLETGSDGWKKLFVDPNNSSMREPIFSLYWEDLEDGGNGIAGRTGSGSNTSQFILDVDIMNLFEADDISKKDIRRGQTYDTLKLVDGGTIDQIWKYYEVEGGVINYENTAECDAKNVLYRFADIVLLRAEAYNQLGDPASAVALLNQIRTRANLPEVNVADFPDKDTLEWAILKERQLEFIAEGKRWFDLVRTGRAIEVMDPVLKRRQEASGFSPVGFDDPAKILFPIHRDILNANTLLTQNPGYN